MKLIDVPPGFFQDPLPPWWLVFLAFLLLFLLTTTSRAHDPKCADGRSYGIPTDRETWVDDCCHEQDCRCVEFVHMVPSSRHSGDLVFRYQGELFKITDVPRHELKQTQNGKAYICVPGGIESMDSNVVPYYQDGYWDEGLNLFCAFGNLGGGV